MLNSNTLWCKVAHCRVVQNQIHFDPALHNRPNEGDSFYLSLWSDRKYWTFSNNSNSNISLMKAHNSWWGFLLFFSFTQRSVILTWKTSFSSVFLWDDISASPDCEMFEKSNRDQYFQLYIIPTCSPQQKVQTLRFAFNLE